jgi:alpha-galactosidase/6-phospho-beta-glucosidase family protein
MPPEGEEGGFAPQPDDASDLWQEKNEPGQGRPKEGAKYGTQKSARGRDAVAKEERRRDRKLKNNKSLRKFEGKERRKTAVNIFDELGKKNKQTTLLNEENILNDDI